MPGRLPCRRRNRLLPQDPKVGDLDVLARDRCCPRGLDVLLAVWRSGRR